MRRLALWLVLLTTVVIAAGCGGGGSKKEVNVNAWASKASAICVDVYAKVRALGPPSPDVATMGSYVAKTIPLAKDLASRISALTPPAGEQSAVSRLSSIFNGQVTVLEKLRDAADAGNLSKVQALENQASRQTTEIRTILSRLGATGCLSTL